MSGLVGLQSADLPAACLSPVSVAWSFLDDCAIWGEPDSETCGLGDPTAAEGPLNLGLLNQRHDIALYRGVSSPLGANSGLGDLDRNRVS